jgi:hypothetical protein
MQHNWLNSMTWSEARSILRSKIVHDFQSTKRRVVYEDLLIDTKIPSYALDLLLCQIGAKDYQLGRARADSVVTRRNKLMPENGYFFFRLNLKKLSPDQDWEKFYEAELTLCCHEFGVELKPACVQLELGDGTWKKLIPLEEIEKRNPGLIKKLTHSGKRYSQAQPARRLKNDKRKKPKPELK